jgi:hypothetical protein
MAATVRGMARVLPDRQVTLAVQYRTAPIGVVAAAAGVGTETPHRCAGQESLQIQRNCLK